MDFGRVPENELDSVDFSLPKDPKATTEVLKASKKKGKTKFYVGCAKWGRKDWIGKLYPAKTKEKDFFPLYAKEFNCIEFNAAFYRLPTPAQVQGWKEKVKGDFIFCPKYTQFITHIKRLKGVQAEADQFYQVMHELGKHLGPVFLLPHPQMGPKQLETIQQFISDQPKDIDLFLELRHEAWYEGKEGFDPILYEFLRKQKRGTIITDTAGRRDCVHMHLSTPECFIRFVGNSLHPTDYTRIDEWVQRIKKWMKEGLETCYFFMHQHEELYSPELIKYLVDELNTHCGTDITPPHLLNDTLF